MTRQWYSRLPIAQKLRVVLMIGGISAITCFGAIYIYYSAHSMRQNLFRETENTANLLGSRNVAALRFQSPETALQNFRVNDDPSYKRQCLYDSKGSVFAQFPVHTECPSVGTMWNGSFKESVSWQHGQLTILKNILANGEIVGAIRIDRTQETINSYILLQLKTMAVIAAGCIFLLFVVTNYLQKLISQPIVEIAKDAQSIVGLGNFEGRLNLRYQDELGQVAEAFNKIIGVMDSRMKELSMRHHDVSQAYGATLVKIEEMATEFLETADSVLVYSEMTSKKMFGPTIERYLPYQIDIIESLDTYNIKLLSLQRIAQIYRQSLEEPKSVSSLREELTSFVKTLEALPIAHIEYHGQVDKRLPGPHIRIYKLAWNEIFRTLSSLLYTLTGIVNFNALLKFDLPTHSNIMIITFGSTEEKTAIDNDKDFKSSNPVELYEENNYQKNTIEDPEVANDFLDDEILQRPQLQYILDSITYIAGANNVIVKHSFSPHEFKIFLNLERVIHNPSTPMVI